MKTVTARFEVAPADSLNSWLRAEKYIKAALKYTDEWLWQDVLAQYVTGQVGLALCRKNGDVFGALIYEVIEKPRKRYFHIHLFGAEPDTGDYWQGACYPQLLAYARTLECDAVTGECRNGMNSWARVLAAEATAGFKIPLWNGTPGDEIKV